MASDDWFMRQINIVIIALANIMFHKEMRTNAELENMLKDVEFSEDVQALMADGKFSKAEKLLYKQMTLGYKEDLMAFVKFYADLNRLDDAELKKIRFSRKKIEKGILNVVGTENLSMGS